LEKLERDKFLGVILGSAVGDALGAPVEFMVAEKIKHKYGRVTEMLGGGRFNLKSGETTDDTAMMLCIAESLIANGGYQPADIVDRFIAWYKTGPKDIGNVTREALKTLEQQKLPKIPANPCNFPSNGSIMRTAPLSLIYCKDETKLISISGEVSSITHNHPNAVLSCITLNLTIVRLLLGYNPAASFHFAAQGIKVINEKFYRSYLTGLYNPNPEKGWAVNTLLIALHCLLLTKSFEDAVIKAVNLGGDADTNAAVTGALAGACYGAKAIPERWLNELRPRCAKDLIFIGQSLYQQGAACVQN
jgi:ADP-ribosyl-[dinitrogen reductase] hydrolase